MANMSMLTNDVGAVAVISTATNTVTANITIASLTATTTIGVAYICPADNSASSCCSNNAEWRIRLCCTALMVRVSVISTASNTVATTINLGYGDSPKACGYNT